MDGLVLIIPALNEAAVISEVVQSCKKVADVIVVDDGSVDGTGVLAANAGAQVIRHEINAGYDAALESGILAGHSLGYRYAITLDGDGQHSIICVEEVYKKLTSGFDLVCGVRDKKQRISEYIFGVFGNLVFGIKDPLCGLKGYSLSINEIRYPFNTFKSIGTELLFRVAKRQGLIAQLYVITIPRADSSRFGGMFIANMRILKSLLMTTILCLKK